MMTMQQAVSRDLDIMGGTLCFTGTCVPVRNVFDYLERGNDIGYFLNDCSWVSKEQVMVVLEHSASMLEEGSSPNSSR